MEVRHDGAVKAKLTNVEKICKAASSLTPEDHTIILEA